MEERLAEEVHLIVVQVQTKAPLQIEIRFEVLVELVVELVV